MNNSPATKDQTNPETIDDPRALPLYEASGASQAITLNFSSLSAINARANGSPVTPVAASQNTAVALRYDGIVPEIVAAGQGELARKILEIAFAAGVKVRQDADLARELAMIEIGSPIPLDCYEAVAEIINYLYKLNQKPRQFVP